MSRSYKKHPTPYIHGESDKRGKQKANRKYRRAAKVSTQRLDEAQPQLREVTSVYDMPKDGKAKHKLTTEEERKRFKRK